MIPIELRSKPIAFIISGKSWVNNHSHVLKTKDEVTSYFLAYYIESLDVRPLWRGATRPKINKSVLENLLVPDIPLDDQRRIVAYLDGLQAKVNALRELQSASGEELSALMPSILDKAFKGKL
jgi:type I restriction enzyme S subunit